MSKLKKNIHKFFKNPSIYKEYTVIYLNKPERCDVRTVCIW